MKIKLLCVAMISTVVLNGCQTQRDTGTLIGAGAGALLGSQFGHGGGQLLATGLGAIAGAFIGSQIGSNMDKNDQLEARQALEFNRTGQTSDWVNPDNHIHYTIMPTRTYTNKHRFCRDYTMEVTMADGKRHKVYGRACRLDDGSWKTLNQRH